MTTERYFETKEQYLAYRKAWKHASVATAAHHMLNNIIRGRDPQFGFTPFQRPSKFEGQGIFNQGAYRAYIELIHLRNSLEHGRKDSYGYKKAERFVAEYGDAFTTHDLKNLDLPNVEPIWSTYGPGRKIAYSVSQGTISAPKTSAELMDLYNSLRKTGGTTMPSQVMEKKEEPAPEKPTWRDAMKSALGRGVKLIDRGRTA